MVSTKPSLVAHWRIILAAILDFFTAFIVLGFVIATIFGGRTEGGFHLSGLPVLLLFALIVVYFWAGKRYFGGTVWKRILGVR